MSALPKTTRRVGIRKYKGRALSIKPQRDYTLTEAERDLYDCETLQGAELLARKLCGDAPYCREEVKGWRIAAVIRELIVVIERVMQSKSVTRTRELERENAALREAVEAQRVELKRLWIVESRCKGGQRELEFVREG